MKTIGRALVILAIMSSAQAGVYRDDNHQVLGQNEFCDGSLPNESMRTPNCFLSVDKCLELDQSESASKTEEQVLKTE